MQITSTLTIDSQAIQQICSQFHIEKLALFGSHLTGRATEASDVDLLVRFNKPIGLFILLEAKDAFAELLDKNVDLVTEDFLSPYFKKDVLEHMKIIYEA